MTDLRAAAQQALEALGLWATGRDMDAVALNDLINRLESSLAEPVQEPVAWIQPDHLQKARVAPFLCRVEPTQRCADFVPLWTSRPQRKPLTDEEIRDLWSWSGTSEAERTATTQQHAFARAIERAHGIE